MTYLPITLGILTYNSADTLERCLASAPDFAEIVLADGGSTDGTQEIGQRYGARIVLQSNPGHPISDFARERNILLDAATQPWFLYMDSDEILSPELIADLHRVITPETKEGVFRVRYLKANADGTKAYRTYKEYYQTRLVRTDVGARFERSVHERLKIPQGVQIGQIEGPWYVLLDADDLSWSVFAAKAWKRTGMTAQAWTPKGVGDVLRQMFVEPATQILKSLIKIVMVRVKWGSNAIPLQYELLRIVYSLFLSIRHLQRFFGFGWITSRKQ